MIDCLMVPNILIGCLSSLKLFVLTSGPEWLQGNKHGSMDKFSSVLPRGTSDCFWMVNLSLHAQNIFGWD